MKNNSATLKILFLADTHLGFDFPIKPKIQKRRRGDDFFNHYHEILNKAFSGECDIVVHGGDMFFRAKVHPSVVTKSFQPLIELAEKGVPVLIVPGNHERSFLPVSLFDTHPNILVFDRPRTFKLHLKNISVAFGGFPCIRKNIKEKFKISVESTKLHQQKTDFKFLCLHQTVEGATVGIQNYTFRYGADIIRGADVPQGLDAVLSGHIHRAQVLHKDLSGNKLKAPVIYPGSIERTSYVEREEKKGYYIIELGEGKKINWQFNELDTRPMKEVVINTDELTSLQIEEKVKSIISSCDPEIILRIKPVGEYNKDKYKFLSTTYLRSCAPSSMNVEVSIPGELFKRR